jgi:ribosome recycling factor
MNNMSVDFTQFDKKAAEAEEWLASELDKIRSGRVSGSILTVHRRRLSNLQA